MERLILKELLNWKNSPQRKPLILYGIPYVGKTTSLQEFGKRYYKDVVFFNLEEHPEYHQFFNIPYDVDHILQVLKLVTGKMIFPESTLIIFDNVRDCPNVFRAVKSIYKTAPQYHIACACSRLPTFLNESSSLLLDDFDLLQMHPMTFTEFLLANRDEKLAAYMEGVSAIEPVPDDFFAPLFERLKMYFITGGMPQSIFMWTHLDDTSGVQNALSHILKSYELEFSKHPNVSEFAKISLIWKSIPSQLAKENKKFFYKVVKEGARAREYENALQWLVDTKLVHKVCHISTPELPFPAPDNASSFKIYLPDVGLLRRMTTLTPNAFTEGDRLFTELSGALSENYVLQALHTQFKVPPRYWSQNNPPFDVDFLFQYQNIIIPVEVIPVANTPSKNLRKYKDLFPDQTKLRVRFSLDNLSMVDDLLNIPLFMADHAARLIELALTHLVY